MTDLVDAWKLEEIGETLEENAALKALTAVQVTGLPAIGDDTGLFVDALNGVPGVLSSRYAGPGCSYEDNVQKLLAAMAGLPAAARTAHFRTAITLACPDGSGRTFEGVLGGSIAERPRGSAGFGYDPVFLLPDGRTLAELDLSEKNRVSHRGAAFSAFAGWVAGRGAGGICPCDPGIRY